MSCLRTLNIEHPSELLFCFVGILDNMLRLSIACKSHIRKYYMFILVKVLSYQILTIRCGHSIQGSLALHLANDHWWRFSTRNACIVHSINSIRFKHGVVIFIKISIKCVFKYLDECHCWRTRGPEGIAMSFGETISKRENSGEEEFGPWIHYKHTSCSHSDRSFEEAHMSNKINPLFVFPSFCYLCFEHVHVYLYCWSLFPFTAICKKSCRNGGKCVAPDVCTCPQGYKPPICRRKLYVYLSSGV